MQVQPYLYFEGQAEVAIEFYKKALGAELEFMMRFNQAPEQPEGDGSCQGAPVVPDGNKIMHANLRIGDSQIMISDGMCAGQANFAGFALTLTQPDDNATAASFAALLKDGGQVQMPLGPTFFATNFGMVRDRFGVMWTVITPLPMAWPVKYLCLAYEAEETFTRLTRSEWDVLCEETRY